MIAKKFRQWKYSEAERLVVDKKVIELYELRESIIRRCAKRDKKNKIYFKPNAFKQLIKTDSDLMEYSKKNKTKGAHKMKLRTVEEILLEDFKFDGSKTAMNKRIFFNPTKLVI